MSRVEFRVISISMATDKRQVRGLTLSGFATWMSANEGVLFDHAGERFTVLCVEQGRNIVGAVIRFRGQLPFIRINPDTLTQVEYQSTDKGDKNQDFTANFFVIRTGVGRGLYQSQGDTFPLNDFRSLWGIMFDKYKAEERAKLARELVKGGMVEAASEAQAARDIAGHATLRVVMTKDEFLKLVAQLAEVRQFHYTADVRKVVRHGGGTSPFFEHAETETRSVKFTAGSKPRAVVPWVKSWLPFLTGGSVRGRDEDGTERVYRLAQHAEIVKVMESDAWRKRTPQCLRDYASSDATKSMIYLMDHERPDLFTIDG